MNKLSIATLLFLISVVATGQSRTVRDFQDKYEGKRDVTFVTLEGSLFKLVGIVAELGDEHDKDLENISNLSEGIDRMVIMDIDDYDRTLEEGEVERLEDDLKKEGYGILMTAREGRKIVKVLSQQTGTSDLRDVVLLITERYDFTLLTIEGIIDLDDLDMLIEN